MPRAVFATFAAATLDRCRQANCQHNSVAACRAFAKPLRGKVRDPEDRKAGPAWMPPSGRGFPAGHSLARNTSISLSTDSICWPP